jgi:hypothetical protein
VAALPLRKFRYLLAGLSARSVFREALARAARVVDNDTAIALLGG